MYATTTEMAQYGVAVANMGGMFIIIISSILTGSIALLGLGFGIRGVARYVLNDPRGSYYDGRWGSGWSRFNRARTDSDSGGHMKSYRF